MPGKERADRNQQQQQRTAVGGVRSCSAESAPRGNAFEQDRLRNAQDEYTENELNQNAEPYAAPNGWVADMFGLTPPEPGDGAGRYDSERPGAKGHALKEMWWGVAHSADAMGLTNAARHMRHFLGNTGTLLVVDPELALRDDPTFETHFQDAIDAQLRLGIDGARAFPTEHAQWSFETPKTSEHYFEAQNSRDWFYALGGITSWFDGWYTFKPQENGSGLLQMDININLFDRYNWDGSKSVTLLKDTPLAGSSLDMKVTDDELGQLHRMGLAQEFEAYGDAHRTVQLEIRPDMVDFEEGGATEGGRTEGGVARAHEKSRIDPTRGHE